MKKCYHILPYSYILDEEISDELAIFSEYDMFSMNLTIDSSFQCPVLKYEEVWIIHVQN